MTQKIKVEKGKPEIKKTVDVTISQVPVERCRNDLPHAEHVWIKSFRYAPHNFVTYCKGRKEIARDIRRSFN